MLIKSIPGSSSTIYMEQMAPAMTKQKNKMASSPYIK